MTDRVKAFNALMADRLSAGLSSMWCGYLFFVVSLTSLPAVLRTGDMIVIVGWFSQNFIQLVALSILAAGQDRVAAKVAAEIHETHGLVMEELQILKAAPAADASEDA